jgi:hypothetical protein
MQYKDHVNLFEVLWPRCCEVSISGANIHCVLDLGRTYDLVSAYDRDPHLQLISCETDEKLLRFVSAWGPLTLSWDDRQQGYCSAPVERYWTFQQWLKRIVALLSAFKNRDQERESLRAFLQAEVARQQSLGLRSDNAPLFMGLRSLQKIEGDVLSWFDNTPMPKIRSAIAFVLQSLPLGATGSLQCTHRSGKPVVSAGWRISSLEEALDWMVWYDEFTQNPLVCCHACRKIFRPESAHARKYCSYECAHRIAAREWQRKRRKLKKGDA